MSLLDAAAAGQEIGITKHGRAVARLVPGSGPRALKGSLSGMALTAGDEVELFSTEAGWNLR